MRFQNIFFDFDGTLADTAEDIRDAYIAGFAKLGTPLPENFARTFSVGPTLENTVKSILPGAGCDTLKHFTECFKECYDTAGFPHTALYPGVRELLQGCRDTGATLFVASNKRLKPTEMLLQKLGIGTFFAEVLTPDARPGEKLKKPEFLRRAVAERRLAASRSLMVGDTPPDIRAGHEAGMLGCAVFWGYGSPEELCAAKPDLRAATVRELLDCVR